MFTIALLGKNPEFNNIVKNTILRNGNGSDKTLNDCFVKVNDPFRIISTHDFFDEECPEQQMNDFMARCSSGVHLFMLAIDSQNAELDKVVSQIVKLQDIFGETVTQHLVVVFENYQSYMSLSQLKEKFHIKMATPCEHLVYSCMKWCLKRQLFLSNYKDCCKEVENKMKKDAKRSEDHHERSDSDIDSKCSANLQTCTYDAPAETPQEQFIGDSKSSMSPLEFNVVLLGLSGTGKSASGNTILTAMNSKLDPNQLFESKPSSTSVTSKCEFKELNVFGREVRVVDTPDFLDEDVDSQAQVDECKKYCQKGLCVVLLVIQMGRFTENEKRILERLEEKLGWKFRESTIVLLTHGENAQGQEKRFIAERTYLDSVVRKCGNRFHVFKNTSKNRTQVIELFKKIPDYKTIFPQFTEKPSHSICCVS